MSVRDGQPSRTTASVYGSGLLRTTDSYPGWLYRTTPDYAGLLPDYFELRQTTSGLLRSATPATGILDTLPKDQPGPRGNYLLDLPSPLCRFTSSNIFITPAIQYNSIINTYSLVHPLVRAPETRLSHSLVARPGATVDGAKYIMRSPRRPAHPATVA